MFRVAVVLTLLPALLLTQWLSVGQCSCACSECDRDGAAHVHVAGLVRNAKKSCCHKHHGCTHASDRNGKSVVASKDAHTAADIVYLPNSLFGGWMRQSSSLSQFSELKNDRLPTLVPHDEATYLARMPCCSPIEGQCLSTFRPVSDGPIYLQTLALLI